MKPILEIRDLKKHFPLTQGYSRRVRGYVKAVDGVTLTIPQGSIFGYLGPNGAGKTTTMKILVGLLHYSKGSVRVFGETVKKKSVELNKKVGFLPDSEMPRNNSIDRFLGLTSKMHGIKKRKERISEVLILLGLKKLRKRKIRSLSKGQKQRVGIARAILADSQILILDEATSNLDSESEELIQASLTDLLANRTTFVIAHRLSTVTRADVILAMDGGRIVERGTHTELMAAGGLYNQMVLRQMRFQATIVSSTDEGITWD